MNYKVLLVDDDQTLLKLFATYLEAQGMDVRQALDGLEALEMLKQEKFDILVTDIRMPKMTGIELIRRSREYQPDLPSVIVSGEGTLSEAAEAVNLKVKYYLEKPVDNLDTLKDVMLDALKFDRASLKNQIDKLEKERELYRNILCEVYRLPGLGPIAVGLTHNINSPLGGIIGYTQLGRMKNPQIDIFSTIDGQAKKISNYLNEVADKGKTENNHQPEEINLGRLVKNEVSFLNYNLFFKHLVEFDLNLDDVPQIMGVYSHFSTCLHHLLQNARDAIFESDKKSVKISTSLNEENILLKVSDTGEGIPEENMDRIFEPGFSTKPHPSKVSAPEIPSGYGIGLSITKQILESYGAQISVKSEYKVGTEITVKIPVEKK